MRRQDDLWIILPYKVEISFQKEKIYRKCLTVYLLYTLESLQKW